MGTPQITNRSKTPILTVLLKNKEMAQFDIPNEVGKHYTTILRQLRKLEKRKLVKVARRERSKKKGKDKKIYTLTPAGVCSILITSNLLYDNPEAIAKDWGHLFPILKKLPLFQKYGVKHYLLKNIKDTLKKLGVMLWDKATPLITINTNRQVYRMLTEKTSPELSIKYNKILQEDPELREGTKGYLRGRRWLAIIRVIEATERLKLVFPLLESDNPDWRKIQKTEEYLRNMPSYGYKEIIEHMEALVTKKKEQYAQAERLQNQQLINRILTTEDNLSLEQAVIFHQAMKDRGDRRSADWLEMFEELLDKHLQYEEELGKAPPEKRLEVMKRYSEFFPKPEHDKELVYLNKRLKEKRALAVVDSS
jgi:DNA-binding PadR family transcriptional regulator